MADFDDPQGNYDFSPHIAFDTESELNIALDLAVSRFGPEDPIVRAVFRLYLRIIDGDTRVVGRHINTRFNCATELLTRMTGRIPQAPPRRAGSSTPADSKAIELLKALSDEERIHYAQTGELPAHAFNEDVREDPREEGTHK